MYERILVTLDTTSTDRAIIEHVKALAKIMHSRVVLLHVADGWAARMYGPDAVSPEVNEDKAYLEKVLKEFQAEGLATEAALAYGDPAKEIVKYVQRESCSLVAMSTHGHRFVKDVLFGTTIPHVQHNISVPILLLRGR